MATAPLAGRTALVTGAGRGIGRALATALGRAGARAVLCGRARSALDRVAAELVQLGAPDPAIDVMDVADAGSIERAVERLTTALPAIDVLVNNAGIAESAPLARTDLAMWTRHLAVNATGPFLLARALVPAMIARRWGRVINIASMAALGGAPYIAAYAASKHALLGLTRALAAETAGTGVTVNAVCPGYAATDMVWSAARRITEKTGKSFEDAVAAMAAFNASGKLIEPDAIAEIVVELATDGARSGEAVVIS